MFIHINHLFKIQGNLVSQVSRDMFDLMLFNWYIRNQWRGSFSLSSEMKKKTYNFHLNFLYLIQSSGSALSTSRSLAGYNLVSSKFSSPKLRVEGFTFFILVL